MINCPKNNLESIRTDKLMTQDELAQEAGVAKTTISRVENGHINPTQITKKRLAKALGVPVDEIFPEDSNE